MGKSKKFKNQEYRSLGTTVCDKGMNESALPDGFEDKAIKYVKDNNIDIYETPPEIKELIEIFNPNKNL